MRYKAKLLEVYRNGDRLEDDELEYLSAELSRLADELFAYGDMFRLQAIYFNKVAYDCKAFLKFRKES